MAHRPLSTTKDPNGPLDSTGESMENYSVRGVSLYLWRTHKVRGSSVQKMHVTDSHIDAHTYAILLTHIFIIIGIPNSAWAFPTLHTVYMVYVSISSNHTLQDRSKVSSIYISILLSLIRYLWLMCGSNEWVRVIQGERSTENTCATCPS